MKHGLSLTETLLEHYRIHHPKRDTGWEIGRLAIEHHSRDPATLSECFTLTANWLDTYTEVQDIFASCSSTMSRLYRRFAFTAFKRDLMIPGGDKLYTEIYGYLPTILDRLNGAELARRQASAG